MLTHYKREVLAAFWIATTLLLAAILGPDSRMGWLMMFVIALGPAVLLLHFSKALPQTMSQRIHHGRR